MILRYVKVRPISKAPERANPSDAGADVFADIDTHILIESLHNALIPTGIRLEVPHGFVALVCPRSGMASKRSLVPGARVIDSGYENEVMIDLHNYGASSQTIQPGDKIAQILIVPVVHARFEEVSQIYDEQICMSNRKMGGFGSTDQLKIEKFEKNTKELADAILKIQTMGVRYR